ncbi:MAG TPA: hypothetical protein VG146_18705 [Verrucomicrobiae bacterium]|nr:hypothetical protein [Verrucomicrobiae bacterium]
MDETRAPDKASSGSEGDWKESHLVYLNILCWLGVLPFFVACASHRPPPVSGTADDKVSLAGVEPGLVLITPVARAAAISFDPPNGRLQSAREGAGDAARKVMNTPNLGNPQIEAAVGAFEFALAPFAAAYGAIQAGHQRLPADKLSDAQRDLAQAMNSNAGSEALCQKVGETARQKTHRLIVCGKSASAAPVGHTPVSVILEVAVEQLQLRTVKEGKKDYCLAIQARARLLRATDGAVLLDRTYHYQSGTALFIDWASYEGLKNVAQTGYQSIADHITDDIFRADSQPPLLIGPGQEHLRVKAVPTDGSVASRVPGSLRPMRLGRTRSHLALRDATGPWNSNGYGGLRGMRLQRIWEQRSVGTAVFQFVSLQQDKATSIEIRTGNADQNLSIQSPTSAGDNLGLPSDTKWALDGLEYDRNAVVQFVSCLAAVPLGLWEQTLGAFGRHSREKTQKLAKSLSVVADRGHLEGALADELARRLRSQAVTRVNRSEEPLSFAFATPAEANGSGTTAAEASVNSKIAIEIQVVNAKLVGKHQNSRFRSLAVEVQATVLRTSDGQDLYSRRICYRSSPKKLKDWAASDAKLFRQELDACSQRTAQAISSELIGHQFVAPSSR